MAIQKTWNEFWGELLLVTFHLGKPERWSHRERKAAWVLSHAAPKQRLEILDLGCGDGILDICLARLGNEVTAVDRLETVLALARQEVKDEPVTFLHADLRECNFPEASYDVVIFFEAIGLMSVADDRDLLTRLYQWVKPGGCLLVDCPKIPDAATFHNVWQLPTGELTFAGTYNADTRLQQIIPTFLTPDGTTVELVDPYDPDKEPHKGLLRYFYPPSELSQMLASIGFAVERVEHYSSEQHYALVARK